MTSSAYGSYKEYDGRSFRKLVVQQRKILEHFDLAKETSEYYKKLQEPGKTISSCLARNSLVELTA